METAIELIKILGPAILVLYAAYLMVRSFLNSKLVEISQQMRQKNQETVLPIRLQAYERICLLLERISLNALIARFDISQYNAKELQRVMISEIREEYNHNVAQQMYMSAEAWSLVKNAVEQTITRINEAGQSLTEENKSLELARLLLENSLEETNNSVEQALNFLKDEMKELF